MSIFVVKSQRAKAGRRRPMSLKEFSQRAGLNGSEVRALVEAGEIRAKARGRLIAVSPFAFDDFSNLRRVSAADLGLAA